jgi:hypothetical protein
LNIFYLDHDVSECAKAHCDKHTTKMILEYAQLLSTAHYVLDGEVVGYKPTHKNHPCAVWVRESMLNYNYVFLLFDALLKEYTLRYGKEHSTGRLLGTLASYPKNIPVTTEMTPIAQCMPDDCKGLDPVEAYRTYYRKHKRDIAKWKLGEPKWF